MSRKDDFESEWKNLFWPSYFAAEAGLTFARNMFAAFNPRQTPPSRPQPVWASPNEIVLRLGAARLRRFSPVPKPGSGRKEETPILVCAPLALHDARVADLCEGHSLMARLAAGGGPLYLVEWLSAEKNQIFRGIDDYLADLNVMVDEIGGACHFVGLCQGGWLSLAYAARFPAKARKLAIAAAPIDTQAGDSPFSALARSTPMETYAELVRLGDGFARGAHAQRFWGLTAQSDEQIHALLDSALPIESEAFRACAAMFRAWSESPLDLPGAFYLEVVEKLYKRDELARGEFVALGKKADLGAVRNPLFLIGARDDEIATPQQTLACSQLVGTPKKEIRERIVPGSHLSLFFGNQALTRVWPEVAAWLRN
jgi:poly(3-hydroxyalkanoate) synthetase